MSEPGMNLGRLVAAERNALAAIETAKQAKNSTSEHEQKIARLESDNAAMKNDLVSLRGLVLALKGSGPTSGG
jgi:hypothetical protein